MNHPLRLMACCLGALLLFASLGHAAEARPNILFLVADDQGPWALGASGNKDALTPNMDRLAKEGMRFTHAFTPTPVCSPARCSILTSRYGTELGITDWINAKVEKGLGLDDKIVTWPALLQKAGYTTALFGKWHVGDLDEQHPTKRGYGTFFGFRDGGRPPRNPILEKGGMDQQFEGLIVDLVADEAQAWLRQHDKQKPFALSIHFREPHAAYLPVRHEDWAKVNDLDPEVPDGDLPGQRPEIVKRLLKEYLASVAGIDRNLGNILATLDELKLSENTIVIYTSDHGYNIGHHGLQHKGNARLITTKESWPAGTENVPAGNRPNMFDTSLHVPLLIRWPKVIRPGTVNAHTVSHLDWLPTLAEVAQAKIPEETKLHGQSILPLWREESISRSEDFYSEYSMKHGATTHMRCYRTPKWKLIRDFASSGRDELYNLENDPAERKNLIADRSPEAQAHLRELDTKILQKMKELNDPALPLAIKQQQTESPK